MLIERNQNIKKCYKLQPGDIPLRLAMNDYKIVLRSPQIMILERDMYYFILIFFS